jgi:hypothetical protein
MSDRVREAHEKVNDEASFICFLQVLAEDRAEEIEKEKESPSSPWGPGHNGWENATIEDFLFAAAAWAQATPPLYKKPGNPWKRCADIILMGKLYE